MMEEKIGNYKLIKNNSKIYYNGSKWTSNSCGEFEIIGKSDRLLISKNNNIQSCYYFCKFDDGTVINASYGNIRKGNVKNPNQPIICKVGYFGIGNAIGTVNGIQTREYTTWASMIKRCYSEEYLKRCPTYRGVEVCDRWKSFQNFFIDLPSIQGYKNWKENKEGVVYFLDKDIYSINIKIYSPETCCFITNIESTLEVNERYKNTRLTGETYLATRLNDGYIEEFINQREFSRKYNIDRKGMHSCLKNKCKQSKGWTFKIKEIDNNDKDKCK